MSSKSCDLTSQRCKPCEGGVPPLSESEAAALASQLDGWTLSPKKIEKTFRFEDFVAAMKFVNRVADVAEAEGHHPDLFIHYNQVTVSLWTHAIGGLSENDFIVAAKTDAVA